MISIPVIDGYITSKYGDRILNEKKEFHPGIDIGSAEEFPIVYSVFKSKVSVVGVSSTFGNRVWCTILEGPHKGLSVVYAHLHSIDKKIKVGLEIEPGEIIGIMGNTGHSFGKHLHFEIRPEPSKPGNSVNPIEVSKLYGKNIKKSA